MGGELCDFLRWWHGGSVRGHGGGTVVEFKVTVVSRWWSSFFIFHGGGTVVELNFFDGGGSGGNSHHRTDLYCICALCHWISGSLSLIVHFCHKSTHNFKFDYLKTTLQSFIHV